MHIGRTFKRLESFYFQTFNDWIEIFYKNIHFYEKNIECRSNRLMMVAVWHDPQSAVVLLTLRLAPHDEQMAWLLWSYTSVFVLRCSSLLFFLRILGVAPYLRQDMRKIRNKKVHFRQVYQNEARRTIEKKNIY